MINDLLTHCLHFLILNKKVLHSATLNTPDNAMLLSFYKMSKKFIKCALLFSEVVVFFLKIQKHCSLTNNFFLFSTDDSEGGGLLTLCGHRCPLPAACRADLGHVGAL